MLDIAFTFQIVATNSPDIYGVVGDLPPGVTMDTDTGIISGTPTGSPGTWEVLITAENEYGDTNQVFTINVTEEDAGIFNDDFNDDFN